MRVTQPPAQRGSQKWIQHAVNHNSTALNSLICAKLPEATDIQWLSPLAADAFSEYRDSDFLQKIGLEPLLANLKSFWPERGPQWDALARFDNNKSVLLVEAKAHIGEIFSPPCGAKDEYSLAKIKLALNETTEFVQAKPLVAWIDCFYQLANRIAYLYFLRKNGVEAKLLLINFVGDRDMGGPNSEAEWKAAYEVVWRVLGMPKRHKLAEHIIEIFPEVLSLQH